MRVRIDPNICQGHAMCALACPELFKLNDEDGHAYLLDENVPPQFEDAVQMAMRSCPEGAISIA